MGAWGLGTAGAGTAGEAATWESPGTAPGWVPAAGRAGMEEGPRRACGIGPAGAGGSLGVEYNGQVVRT